MIKIISVGWKAEQYVKACIESILNQTLIDL